MLHHFINFRLLFIGTGIVLIFASNRYFTSYEFTPMLIGAGFFALIFAMMVTLVEFLFQKKAHSEREARIWLYSSLWIASIILGLALYFVYDAVTSSMQDGLSSPLSKLLLVAWLSLILFGLSFGVGTELGIRASGKGDTAEPERVLAGGLNWLSIGLFLGFLVCVNYAGVHFNKTFDWSYFKTTEPGDATKKMVSSLEDPIEVGLFFSRNSDALPFVRQYTETLRQLNPKLQVKVFDKDFSPTEAERFRVSRNGQLVLMKDSQRQRISIGDDIDRARKKLKSLDASFQKALLPLIEDKKVIYVLEGHGEMGWKLSDSRSLLRSVKKLEALLRAQNFRVRDFSLSDGKYNKLPDDAAILAILGPAYGIPPAEIEIIKDYVNKGGSLLLFMDLEFGGEQAQSLGVEDDGLTTWLAELGLRYETSMLANDRVFYRATRKSVDHWFLGTNNISSHGSVQNLTKLDNRMGVLTFQSGYFEIDAGDSEWKLTAAIRSLASSFTDNNRNFQVDNGEQRKAYPIAVAGEKGQSKLFAFADATMASDPLIANPGNQLAIIDVVRWLSGFEDFSGATESEEDVKIQHSKSRELFVFHGSIYAVPILVLLAGFIATRRKRG